MSYDRRPWASLKERAPHIRTDSPSAAVDRDCICVGGRDTLRSIYLRCSASFTLKSDFSRERNAKKKARRATPCRPVRRDSFTRSTFAIRIANVMRLRYVKRADRVIIFVEQLEKEEVESSWRVRA